MNKFSSACSIGFFTLFLLIFPSYIALPFGTSSLRTLPLGTLSLESRISEGPPAMCTPRSSRSARFALAKQALLSPQSSRSAHSALAKRAQSDPREMADRLRNRGLHPLLVAGLISMIPIFELRGGIPVGIALFKLNPLSVYFTCVVFNLVPVLPILLLLNPLRRLLEKVPLLRGLFRFLQKKAERNRELVERYEEMGLALFVAIPLPVTGAWTGSVIAEILNLRVMKSFLFITLGVSLAGVIVTMLTLLRLYGLIIAGGLILVFAAVYILRIRRSSASRRSAMQTSGDEHHDQ